MLSRGRGGVRCLTYSRIRARQTSGRGESISVKGCHVCPLLFCSGYFLRSCCSLVREASARGAQQGDIYTPFNTARPTCTSTPFQTKHPHPHTYSPIGSTCDPLTHAHTVFSGAVQPRKHARTGNGRCQRWQACCCTVRTERQGGHHALVQRPWYVCVSVCVCVWKYAWFLCISVCACVCALVYVRLRSVCVCVHLNMHAWGALQARYTVKVSGARRTLPPPSRGSTRATRQVCVWGGMYICVCVFVYVCSCACSSNSAFSHGRGYKRAGV